MGPERRWDHNLWLRMEPVALHANASMLRDDYTLLDVGGGEGRLKQFLPVPVRYTVADKNVNGIDGTNLPYMDGQFDVVTAIHTLEHIQAGLDRKMFLDEMCRVAKHYAILSGPCDYEDARARSRMQLFVDVFGADWAKEHIRYGLPTIPELREYADARRYNFYVAPVGCLTTAWLLALLRRFAHKRKDILERVNRELNSEEWYRNSAHEGLPAFHLVAFSIKEIEP